MKNLPVALMVIVLFVFSCSDQQRAMIQEVKGQYGIMMDLNKMVGKELVQGRSTITIHNIKLYITGGSLFICKPPLYSLLLYSLLLYSLLLYSFTSFSQDSRLKTPAFRPLFPQSTIDNIQFTIYAPPD